MKKTKHTKDREDLKDKKEANLSAVQHIKRIAIEETSDSRGDDYCYTDTERVTLEICPLREDLLDGDKATYRYVDFAGETAFSMTLRVDAACRVEMWVDDRAHATRTVDASPFFGTQSTKIPSLTGRHAVTFRFAGELGEAAVDGFCFDRFSLIIREKCI